MMVYRETMALYEDEEEERLKINAFDWDGKDGFPEIMKNGGFDAVIGNPPYVVYSARFLFDDPKLII